MCNVQLAEYVAFQSLHAVMLVEKSRKLIETPCPGVWSSVLDELVRREPSRPNRCTHGLAAKVTKEPGWS